MDAGFRLTPSHVQNKKRKFNRDRDDRDEREKTPEEPEDPLKDATTLYVGNLYVETIDDGMITTSGQAYERQVLLHHRRANP